MKPEPLTKQEDFELLVTIRKNLKEIKEDLHSCLARLHVTNMALNDLIRRLEEEGDEK